MRRAHLLLIEEKPDGVFLYRYDPRGECVGDTWHLNIEDAKHQATYEYAALAQDWEDVPEEIEDPVVYGLSGP